MRSRLNILFAVAAAILVVPQFATADSVEDQLQLMNERMGQLEDQLQATQDELGASTEKVAQQGEVIEKAGLDREAQSGLSSFYNQVQISGWLAASWFYNLRSPNSDIVNGQQGNNPLNPGRDLLVAPFHPDHNSFSVDQLWFEIEKPVIETAGPIKIRRIEAGLQKPANGRRHPCRVGRLRGTPRRRGRRRDGLLTTPDRPRNTGNMNTAGVAPAA